MVRRLVTKLTVPGSPERVSDLIGSVTREGRGGERCGPSADKLASDRRKRVMAGVEAPSMDVFRKRIGL